MSTDRDKTVDHILAIEKHVYQWLQLGGLPNWAVVDLTMPQLKLLLLVGGQLPLPTSQVARTLGMTLSSATGVVDRLVSQGLVQRMVDPSDRRIVLLGATPSGMELIEQLMRGGRLRLKEILDRLEVDDLHVVAQAMDLLHGAAVYNSAAVLPLAR